MDLILQQVLVSLNNKNLQLLIVNFFSGLPPTTNGSGQQPQQQQNFLNQVNVHKHHTPQHTVPVQSTYLASPPITRNGLSPSSPPNIYHFSHQQPQKVKKNSEFFTKKNFNNSFSDSNIFRRRTIKTSSTTSRCDCYNLSLKNEINFFF
jgi:hypothetical protein